MYKLHKLLKYSFYSKWIVWFGFLFLVLSFLNFMLHYLDCTVLNIKFSARCCAGLLFQPLWSALDRHCCMGTSTSIRLCLACWVCGLIMAPLCSIVSRKKKLVSLIPEDKMENLQPLMSRDPARSSYRNCRLRGPFSPASTRHVDVVFVLCSYMWKIIQQQQ